MKYPKLVQELGLELVCVSISVADHLRYYRGKNNEEIRRELGLRCLAGFGDDISSGSTYVIDLGHDVCYRFKNHGMMITDMKFLGFKNFDTNKYVKDADSEFLARNSGEFYISEGFESGQDSIEMHKSTAIVACHAVPVRVAAFAVSRENAVYLREWENAVSEKRIPLPREAVNFCGRKSFVQN